MKPSGAEIRRVLSAAVLLVLGDRPAGAVNGARGEEMLALRGVMVCTDVEMSDTGEGFMKVNADVEVDRAKECFTGVLLFPFVRLLGERRREGSRFSES